MGDTDGNNTLTWVLPEVVDPPDTICVTLHIPNDRHHIMAFKGAMFDLSNWWNWERDQAHTATRVAQVWRKIFYSIKFGCSPEAANTYEDFEAMPRFRDHCEHELFYIGCDDTEHQVAFLDNVPAGGQAGNGSPQPAPGGGQQNYCQTLLASQQMFIPTLINSGDTIELVSAHGSWWDGGENSLGFPIWRCPDGEQFVAGVCTGPSTEHITGTDPVVGAAHMSLIVYIGATAYSLESGAVTVPGGVANGNAVVQVNDTAISNNQGSADVCIKVTNNKAAAWSHTFDFTTTPGGWVEEVFDGSFSAQWIAAVGWQAIVPHSVGIKHTVATGTVFLPGAAIDSETGDSTLQLFIWDHAAGPITNLLTLASPYATAAGESVYASKENLGTLPTIKSISLNGLGVDPF